MLYRQQGGTPRTVAEQRQHGARAALARRQHPHPASAAPRAPCSPPYRADGCEGAHRLAVQLLRRDEPRPAARGSAVRHRSDVRNEGTRHSAHELILRPCSLRPRNKYVGTGDSRAAGGRAAPAASAMVLQRW